MDWNDRAPLDHVVENWLPAGQDFKRCYSLGRSPAAFFGALEVRFGAAPKGMLYTGDTDAAAVAETLLRKPQPIPGTRLIALPYDHVRQRGLATLRLLKPVKMISLARPGIHALIQDAQRLNRVRQLLEMTRGYEESSAFARAVLNQVPGLGAMAWPSRRVDGETVFCFYHGEVKETDFEVIETSPFHTTKGYERLEAAVEACGLTLFRDQPAGIPSEDDP